ncbi:MarR family winged helix-turn-helix transcriptional regulator [Pseudocolwellia sp. HL-MZ19]|uniref:MarR family winged helix-turn-helix transcriptional regulator n=1 Tax=Pseudocolwellia sp. HL-MZ19 TaxID=3400846 RepID=UPI003CF453C5
MNNKNTLPEDLNKYKPSSDEFEFRQFPFYWLMRVSSAYSMKMDKSLKKLNINSTAWRILLILREEGALSVSEIASHAVAKMPTITKSTYKLQSDNLVNIKTSEKDGRVSIVVLTDKGTEAVSEIIRNTKKAFEHIYDDLSSGEVEQLNKTLHKLFHNLDTY